MTVRYTGLILPLNLSVCPWPIFEYLYVTWSGEAPLVGTIYILLRLGPGKNGDT